MQRKEFIGLSFLSLFSFLSKKVFGDLVEKPKPTMTVLKRFFSCQAAASPGTFQGYFPFSFEPYYGTGYFCEAVDSPPSGFIELLDVNGSLYGYTVIGAAAGTYEIIVQAAPFGGTYTQFLLQFELTGECATEEEIDCCDTNVELRWLGKEGGIKQWSFPGVRNFKNNIGDANTFKNSSKQLQYSERKDIYSAKRVTTGSISLSQRQFIEEIAESIQAWEVNGETFTPIVVANESFPEYSSTDKFFDLAVQYVFAEEIRIQTQ